jgi:hypothetical protein
MQAVGRARLRDRRRLPPGDDCSAVRDELVPGWRRLVAACKAHGCPSDGYETLQCQMGRPDCGEGLFSVIKDGCWVCVAPDSCSVAHDPRCDDGTTPTCDKMPPICSEIEILAYVNNCYICVNRQFANRGRARLQGGRRLRSLQTLRQLRSVLCPICLDCVPRASRTVAHGRKDGLQPNTSACEAGQTAIVKDGCWLA